MIYFIQEIGLFRNRVKIGVTSNIKNRLVGLRCDSPSKLKVRLILGGDKATETIYHEQFAQYRLHGEWFRFGFHLRLFIWLNSYKSHMLNKVNNEVLLNEKGYEFEIDEDDLLIVERFKVYITELDDSKFVWRRATQASFANPNSYGTHYTNKLKLLLNMTGIDYPEKTEDQIKENNLN